MRAAPRVFARLSKFAALFVCLGLIGDIGYLVVSQYHSRLALQEAQLRQLTQDVEKRAAAVRYFLSEREADLSGHGRQAARDRGPIEGRDRCAAE